ncbi:hypothetical protein ACFORJ_06560 [Corynebacterium hansenii]|uniref:Uncharacterized protein n=1 Tax=Corynebacterium hansenii TaxID=394964 RepID=A0ABV7ZQY4_9CORY|nr:hypothetical protein [Corynebacterium hansenii]WJZ00409.1 hypothetical protein CHAN_09005 [Corynebacterium hansenii]
MTGSRDLPAAASLSHADALHVLGDPVAGPPPLVQVVQARGAVLEWLVGGSRVPTLTVTDPAACDWLWRLIGERGHAAVVSAMSGEPGPALPEGAPAMAVDVEWEPELLGDLRRLAHGHWLRAWWPASPIDGVAALDGVLLHAELAVAAADLDDLLSDGADAVDGPELAGLRDHAEGLRRRAGSVDPEVRDVALAALELIEEPAPERSGGWRDDYALVAGGRADADEDAVASGTVAHDWHGVPAGTLDASESAVTWALDAAGAVELTVRAAVLGGADASGIPVWATVGGVVATGELGADGTAVLPIAIGAAEAWALDADDVEVHVGRSAGAANGDDDDAVEPETAAVRDRVRAFAARRLELARGDGGTVDEGAPFVVEKLAARLSR